MATYKVPVEHSDGFSASQVIMTNADKLLVSTDTPTLAGLNLTNCAVLGANSAVFQPGADSTTFFQIKDQDGGMPVFNVDTTNERVLINTTGIESIGAYSLGIDGNILLTNTKGLAILDNEGVPRTVFLMEANNNLSFRSSADTGSVYLGLSHAGAEGELHLQTNGETVVRIKSTGRIGIFERYPETLLEMTHATPYITFHNDTLEDTDGGRESRLIFKGEQSGEEETTLGMIEFSHDGAADDQKGKIGIYTNDGDDDDSPTLRMTIDSTGLATFSGDITADNLNVSDWDAAVDYDYSDISGNDVNTDVTGAELEELTDGSETTLHTHAPVLVNRGDVADYDFTETDLTTDFTWRDLDLSAIVPAGAIAVYLRTSFRTPTAGSLVQYRENGNSNAINIEAVKAFVADMWTSKFSTIFCDANRVIEYAASNVTWTDIDIAVCGWYL